MSPPLALIAELVAMIEGRSTIAREEAWLRAELGRRWQHTLAELWPREVVHLRSVAVTILRERPEGCGPAHIAWAVRFLAALHRGREQVRGRSALLRCETEERRCLFAAFHAQKLMIWMRRARRRCSGRRQPLAETDWAVQYLRILYNSMNVWSWLRRHHSGMLMTTMA